MAGDKKQVKKTDSASRTEKKKASTTASQSAPAKSSPKPAKKVKPKAAAPVKASAPAKKRAPAKAARPIRVLAESGKAVNAGPLRGNNTFPESNRAGSGKHTGGRVGPAADSTSGPGGKVTEGGNRGDKGGKGKPA